jgi:methyl-accepting chemotaxis protein
MNDTNGLSSLFVDRKIGTKVALGFVCVLAILATVSAMAWSGFHSSEDGFGSFSQRVTVVGIADDIDRSFLNLRRFVREYAITGQDADVESAKKEQTALNALLQQGRDQIKNPERHQIIEDILRQTDIYLKDFDQLIARTRDQAKLARSSLDPVGAAQEQKFAVLIAAAAKAGDATTTELGNTARTQFMIARLDAAKVLWRHEASAREAAEKDFTALTAQLVAIDAATKAAGYHQAVVDLQAGVAAYDDAFRKSLTAESEVNVLINTTMRVLGDKVQADAEAIKTSGIAEEKLEQQSMLATMDSASTTILGLSVGGMVLGVVLAWLIGRGIAGPVVRMCTAMRALADGDRTIAVPGLGRKDEVGQMAAAVQVFKDSLIETERLRLAHEQHKIETEAARKAAMLRLADTFESSIKGVVQSVASQATEMQASATTLASTAEQATAQATAVAAAVEQASTNVQTVASSAEELTSSVLEIGRQMEQSSKIAHQAVGEADRTNIVVEGLSKTAQRIGEVVQLIQTIANQTNLLALNATIEAARAGDAGKGFAVVASEVKSLANQTAKATSDIKTQIDDIQATTGHTVDAIRTIGGIIRQMNEIATAIASAVEEQGAATREIAANVHQAAQGTSAIATNIEGVSRAAGDTGAAATQLLGAAGGLSKQAETLRHDVDSFLANVRAA